MPAPRPRTRLVALVGALAHERQATHTANFPLDPSHMLPVADVLVIVGGDATDEAMDEAVDAAPDDAVEEASRDSATGVLLSRHTAHGELGGDTFHASVAEAMAQATAEYGEALGAWEPVPDTETDAHAFAVRYANDRLDHRDGR